MPQTTEFLEALKEEGYEVHYLPSLEEPLDRLAFNTVTIGPRELVMSADSPVTQAFFEDLGIKCHTVPMDELGKAAGAIGCLTGVVRRDMV